MAATPDCAKVAEQKYPIVSARSIQSPMSNASLLMKASHMKMVMFSNLSCPGLTADIVHSAHSSVNLLGRRETQPGRKAFFSTRTLRPFGKSSLNCSFGPAPGHHGCLVGSFGWTSQGWTFQRWPFQGWTFQEAPAEPKPSCCNAGRGHLCRRSAPCREWRKLGHFAPQQNFRFV